MYSHAHFMLKRFLENHVPYIVKKGQNINIIAEFDLFRAPIFVFLHIMTRYCLIVDLKISSNACFGKALP